MRAEAVSWDDWSASHTPPLLDEDKWHVALAPDEVKIVSLEQLDDLFRLSIVDSETKVWQTGMSEWQPLRVIAGIEDEPPAPKRSHPKPPSPRSTPPAPPRREPAPISAYAAPVSVAFAPTQPSFAPPAAALNQFTSVRPLVVSQAPQPAARGGGFGRFLLGLAVLAGVGVSLYRNGIVRDAATSLHREALYAKLEAALGGPAFGTLRNIEQSTMAASLSLPVSLTSPTSPTSNLAASDRMERAPSSAPVNAIVQLAVPSGAMPPVVSLESLAPEKGAAAHAKPDIQAAPAMTNATKSLAPQLQARTEVTAAPLEKQTKVAKEQPAKPAPVERSQPSFAEKPESEMTAREKLNAAIGRSMLSPEPSKGKRAKANSDYDPLNPKL